MTIKNTLPDFFWLTNYLETLISCTLWLPCTSATSARLYKKRLMEHARKTGFPEEVNLGFSCHDFSMRGMAGLDAAIISGMAHMTSFCGSETIPAIEAVEHYYNANVIEELVAATVPATEHSVACSTISNFEDTVEEIILDDFGKLIGYIDKNGNKNLF